MAERDIPPLPASPAPFALPPMTLSPADKAAIIVRFLLEQGTDLPLTRLSDEQQSGLAERMARMRVIDRGTLLSVIAEFTALLEEVGLTFPTGIEATLSAMDGRISSNAASRVRRLAAGRANLDPWERLAALPPEEIRPIVERESVEVGAVFLSKLPIPKAAATLSLLPGEKARRIAYAISQTSAVQPETVALIGRSLAGQLDSQPVQAFSDTPVQRVGAILNVAPQVTREDVLAGLETEDEGFAGAVRKAIFTFAHLPRRLNPRDISKVVRAVDQAVLVTALAGAQGQSDLEIAAEFILSNLSQRMTQGLREEMANRGTVKPKDADAAMGALIQAVRQLEAANELSLIQDEDSEG